jgi:basic membrane lipoprotein Med (substrate-binding protein (PBP1-ABC) superfamily)
LEVKNAIRALVLLVALAMLAAACGDYSDSDGGTDTTAAAATETTAAATETTAAATETTAAATETTEAMADGPTDLAVGLVLLGVAEEPWYSTMIDSIARVAVDAPHGLNITSEIFENISYADGERIMRDLASSGKYQMIIAHSAFSDGVNAVKAEFPDILFAFSGSGNTPEGGNGYWIDVWVHEPAYLAGIIAGMMTETDKISGVAAFPFPNVNGPLNAWLEGAKSVNPAVEANVNYIESWFDPATAKESAVAQIAAGSDMVYMERFGPLEAVQDADGVFSFGHFSDQIALDEALVLTSPVAKWDPAFSTLVDEWYAHMTEGTEYNAPLERIMFFMAAGGADIGAISDSVPADVQAAVTEARDQILSGDLVVEFNDAPIE